MALLSGVPFKILVFFLSRNKLYIWFHARPVMAPKVQAKPVVKPVASIVKKRTWLVPAIVGLVIIIAVILLFVFVKPTEHKTILATVNGEPIYEEDIDKEYGRLPQQYQEQLSKEVLLNQTIEKLLLLQEARARGIVTDEAKVSAQIREIAAQLGIEENQLEQILAAQNVTMEEYRGVVRETLTLQALVTEAISAHITVTDTEVITYYESHPEEFSAPQGGAIVSHILVENESTAKDIIAQLNKDASFSKLAQEYSIDPGSATNDGYIGLITNETPVVPEFKAAALKLREGQYTRAPVQSEFGYHVILRNADTIPLRIVREQIRNQLEVEKQQAAFATFMQSLRNKAEIRYYTTSGVVTQSQTTDTSLDSFATCVGGKTTLYGTSWSQFFQEQQALFGDSFAKLTYIDCDTKPHLCSAANIEKYPTWVIGSERYGKLSLKQLSEFTGCDLP
jgi:parvulin-like peptidyl-prolyl isomerase